MVFYEDINSLLYLLLGYLINERGCCMSKRIVKQKICSSKDALNINIYVSELPANHAKRLWQREFIKKML